VAQIKQIAAALIADAKTPSGNPLNLDNAYDQALWLTQS
jgi:hypothetical protein